jgi:hypothetical protein
MKTSLIFFREETRPSRWLTWPVVMVGVGAITFGGQGFSDSQQSTFRFVLVGGVLCALVLLELVALVLEVREMEVRFYLAPFYCRRIATANILRWTVRTYPASSGRTGVVRSYWQPPRHCVQLVMKDGSNCTLTVRHPQHLSEAIAKAKAIEAGAYHPQHSSHAHHHDPE